MRRMGLAGIVAALIFCSTTSQAHAQLESQLGSIAGDIARVLESGKYSSTVLTVEGLSAFPSSAPTVIREVLGAELTKKQIQIKKLSAASGVLAKLTLVEVKDAEDSNPKKPPQVSAVSLILDVTISDNTGKPIGSIESRKKLISNPGDVARLLGLPFEVQTNARNEVVEGPGNAVLQAIRQRAAAVQSPAPFIAQLNGQPTVLAKDGGDFGMEVLVANNPRPIQVEEGLATVELARRDKCQIRLINKADFEVGVRLALDGIDSFWFSEQKVGFWIVPPKGSIVVKGWQLDANDAREFTVVPFSESVAAQVGSTGDVGVISASFYRAYKTAEEIPDNDREPPPTKFDNGIGSGELLKSAVKRVERHFGKVRACVPVRYIKPKD